MLLAYDLAPLLSCISIALRANNAFDAFGMSEINLYWPKVQKKLQFNKRICKWWSPKQELINELVVVPNNKTASIHSLWTSDDYIQMVAPPSYTNPCYTGDEMEQKRFCTKNTNWGPIVHDIADLIIHNMTWYPQQEQQHHYKATFLQAQ